VEGGGFQPEVGRGAGRVEESDYEGVKAIMKEIKFNSGFNTYLALNIIGQGGSGIVYKVKDENGDIYAIKCLDTNKSTTEKRKRFRNEISFCLKNTNKNILTIIEYGVTTINGKDTSFYVMPYYAATLRDLMKSGIPKDKIISYFGQILNGVEDAHFRSIWHRDLKPENILYDADNDNLLVADFGIAHFSEKYLETSLQTNPQTKLANFQYAAPEQRSPGKVVNQKADIFALGLILNEMFTGMVIQGTGFVTIASVAQNYSYLDQIVDGMIKQASDERFASIDVIKQRLIAYRNEFISRQKISELSNKVIPTSEIDDPLVINPVTVIGVNYEKGSLIFTLSQSVNNQWKFAFSNIGNFSHYFGYAPSLFKFDDNKAYISSREPTQKDIEYFQDYVSKANIDYAQQIRDEKKRKEETERQRLQQEIDEEEKKQRILKSLKL
jgi:serine/threonine protein kinase